MKKILTFLLLFIVINVTAQLQKVEYKNENLQNVFKDLEKRFDVHFSYNSTLLADKKFSFKDNKADLDIILLEISLLHKIKIEYLDASNIIVTKFGKYDKVAFNDSNFLEEVIIKSEYLTFGFDKNKSDGTLSLQPQKLGVLPGLTEPDVMQSLQMLPGISSPSESASKLHIRGGTPDQNLVLFDGIKMYHQGHLFGMISPFNPYITEKVDIYRSGTSAKYGDRIAGVIDMRTTNEIPDEFESGAGANLISADAFIKTPIINDKLGAVISFRRSLTDVFNSPTYQAFGNKVFQNSTVKNIDNITIKEEQTVLEDKFAFTDASAKLIIKPHENHTINLSALTISNNLKHATSDSDLDGLRDNLDLQNQGASAQWNAKFSNKLTTKAFAYFSNYDTDYKYTDFEENVVENSFFKDNDIQDFGVQAKAIYQLDTLQTVSMGYDWSNLQVNYNLIKTGEDAFTENKNSQLNTQSVFGEYEFRNNKLYVRAGVRGNYFAELEKFTIEPRAYVDYKIDNNWTVKASAEMKNQAISQLVSFSFNNLGLDNTIWAVADKTNVPVLENKQFTGGFMFSKRGWMLDVEGYYKNVSGLSSFTRGFNITNNNSSYIVGNSTIYGVDFLLKKKIKKFRTWLGYSLSKNDFQFNQIQPESFAGNYDQRHIISWSNTYKYDDFQFSLGWQYNTGKPFTKASLKIAPTPGEEQEEVSVTTSLLNYGNVNANRLDNYHRLDLSAVYDFYLDSENKYKARIGASVMNTYKQNNVVDKKFKAEYNGELEQYQLIEQTTIGLNVTPNVVFRINF